jgi:hypothetical protein
MAAGNALVGEVVGHDDVDVHAVALRSGDVHLLEPKRWSDASRVDDGNHLSVAIRRRPLVLMAEDRLPERTNRVDVERVDGDFDAERVLRLARPLRRRGDVGDRCRNIDGRPGSGWRRRAW